MTVVPAEMVIKNKNRGLFVFVSLFVCFKGNKILVPDKRLEIHIKHPAIGSFVWSPGVSH